ncbi:MAG: YkvA family protein [Oscillospiraceae bacterium]|nr:YkvA family protein [Oscillospiraceae bacterium]
MEEKKKQLVRSAVIAVAAVIYLVSPIDIIPDTFLGFGQMDDLAVAVLAVLQGVKAWRLWHGVSAAPKDAQSAPIETTATPHEEEKSDI